MVLKIPGENSPGCVSARGPGLVACLLGGPVLILVTPGEISLGAPDN